jgi:hypothetical protein
MPSFRAAVWLMAWITLTTSVASIGSAGEPKSSVLKQYWGKIISVRVDRCGKRPGLCEGVVVLAQGDGRQLALAIRPGTWIKRGDHLVLLEELGAGGDVHVQAIEIGEGAAGRATTIEVTNP